MKFVINLLLMLLISNCLNAAQTAIGFHAHIDEKAARLGDIVFLTPDTEHWAQYALPGHPRSDTWLTKEGILSWMHTQGMDCDCLWQGVHRAKVAASTTTKGQALIDKAQQALEQKLSPDYLRVAIEPVSKVLDSAYALDAYTPELSVSYPVKKRVCVWLKHPHKDIPIWFRVSAYAKVLVAEHALKAHAAIPADAVHLKVRNIAGLRGIPLSSIPDAAWTSTPVSEHSVLVRHQLKPEPLVKKGQLIQVECAQNTIHLTLDAMAQEDGALHQRIVVKNPKNQHTLMATVTGADRAEVSL